MITLDQFQSQVSAIQLAVPDLRAKDHADYIAEYGVRTDDQAMVFHFFPKKSLLALSRMTDEQLKARYPADRLALMEKTKDWDNSFGMDKRLERAIPKCFKTENVSADYADEMSSFCIIVGGLGASADPWPLVNRFFSEIDAPL